MGFEFQGDIELLCVILDRVGSDGSEHDVRNGADIRWACDDGVRMANSGGDDHDGGDVNGGDLLCFSDFRWTLLLERHAQRRPMGSLCFLDHGLVRFSCPPLFFFSHW